MKLTLLILLFTLTLQAQDTLKLRVDNPQPRVGDQVRLFFSLKFIEEDLQNQLPQGVATNKASSIFGRSNNSLSRALTYEKSGPHTIGPFHFHLNGKDIYTDSIVMDVLEELPLEVGLWVRYATSNGKHYIIMEQMIESDHESKNLKSSSFFQSSSTKSSSSTTRTSSYSIGGENKPNDKYAQLTKTPEEGVTVALRNSRSNTIASKKEERKKKGLAYSYKLYEIQFGEDYAGGNLKLKKEHFLKLPKKAKIKTITISPQGQS